MDAPVREPAEVLSAVEDTDAALSALTERRLADADA